MGLITRSEAAHRLKIIQSHLSCAINAAREGEWEACSNAAVEVSDLLDAIRPHLAEAAEEFPSPPVGSLKYNPPMPDKTDHAFGYSGSASTRSKKVDPNGIYAGMSSGKPPAPIVNGNKPPAPIKFNPLGKKFSASLPEKCKCGCDYPDHWKDLARAKDPARQSSIIVTPAPAVRMLDETRTFDLSVMSIGEPESYKRIQEDIKAGRTPTETNWEMTEAFERLSPESKAKIIRKYRETGQPVTLSD